MTAARAMGLPERKALVIRALGAVVDAGVDEGLATIEAMVGASHVDNDILNRRTSAAKHYVHESVCSGGGSGSWP